MNTIWNKKYYDPQKAKTPRPAAEPPHHFVLNALYAGLQRIEEIANELGVSRTYVNQALLDMAEHGLVEKRRLYGHGMRIAYFPKGAA